MIIDLRGIWWEIKAIPAASPELDGNCGMCYYCSRQIFVDNNLAFSKFIETIYHELTHAMLDNTTFNTLMKEMPMYESFVDLMSREIAVVCNDSELSKKIIKFAEKECLTYGKY